MEYLRIPLAGSASFFFFEINDFMWFVFCISDVSLWPRQLREPLASSLLIAFVWFFDVSLWPRPLQEPLAGSWFLESRFICFSGRWW